MKGFIVHPTYEVKEGRAFIHLFGRLQNGESFMTINEFKPYFFIRKSDLNKALEIERFDYEATRLKNFEGEVVAKIILNVPAQVKPLRNKLLEQNIPCYEADIRFEYRFMIDHLLQGSIDIQGESVKGESVDRVFVNSKLKPADYIPKNLKVLSIDVETDKKVEQLYSISLYTQGFQRVIIISNKKLKKAISVKDEREALLKFKELVHKLDPDVITGWNLIDFDLKFLENKFRSYNLPFLLGRGDLKCSLRIFHSFFQDSRAEFPGRVVLDGIQALKNNFIGLPDYKLETASNHFLGKGKLFKGVDRYKEIDKAYKSNQQLLIEYNLLDAKLAYDVLYKSTALDLSIQRSIISGMPIDRVRASIASLDSLYLKELRKRGFVAGTSTYDPDDEPGLGGYVMSPKPGIYDYVIVCDFKSLYPSIIRTFNIDPLSFVPGCKGKNLVKAPNGACFRNEDGILPMLIQKLWVQREKARKEKNEFARFAIKTLMNSFYGVLGNTNCRFHNRDVSNAITYFGQHLIKLTAKKVQEMGYEVIYGDTDSIFVNLNVKNYAEASKIGRRIPQEINEFFLEHTQKNYKRKNFLELEFEKVYKRFLMPRTRHSEAGSKKRYAGLLEDDKGKEKIEFVGLEFVRRDWTNIAKVFQQELFDRVFHKKEVADYIKKTVDEIKKGKHDKQLIYRKAIRKRVEQYTKTTPPHVKAARLLGKDLKSNLIEYVITTAGPEPIQKKKHKIDYDHYIEKQIKPIADSVLGFYNQTFDDIIAGTSQKTLFGF